MTRRWIWLPSAPEPAEDSVALLGRFRAEFESASEISALPVSITADSRYRLYVNGTLAAYGPMKPTDASWFVDTIDIAPLARLGTNVVAVEVLAYRADALGNVSIRRSGTPALSIHGELPGIVDFADRGIWRCSPAPGRVFLQGVNTVFLGVQERVDATIEPGAWTEVGFDEAGWVTPVGVTRDSHDPARVVEARTIPLMSLDAIGIVGVSRQRGEDPGWGRLVRGRSVTIAPHQNIDVDLDLGVLTTAFISLEISEGRGASVQLTAAECYESAPLEIPWTRLKGDRTDAEGADLYGDPDEYLVAGWGQAAEPEVYSPFWFRTLRYLRISVQTDEAPLTIHGLALTETRYPLAVTGSFRSSAPLDSELWQTSLRTLRNCMHETFEDCPFYEQLQYAMDTRSQALFSLHLSTDDRLVRRAITDFALSGDPNGLTESRAPSIQPQFIPGFSLFWVFMLAEHLEYVGDRDFTSRYLDRMDSVLAQFDASLASDGFVLSPPERPATDPHGEMWNFVDWTDAWRDTRGVPHLDQRRANTILTFQYVAALRSAERVAVICGRPGLAGAYQSRAEGVLEQLRRSSAWDSSSGYYRDSSSGAPESQHAQVWAVLAGAVVGQPAADLLSRAVRDPDLAPCSYAMSHSLFDALQMAGLHELVDWTPWQRMLELNLTTWAEDTVSNRSDCHGWGAVPLQHFPRWVLGVAPTSPGFDSVKITPVPSGRTFAEGVVPTPRGPIEVRWEQRTPTVLSVAARVPATILVEFAEESTQISRSRSGDVQVVTFDYPVPARHMAAA